MKNSFKGFYNVEDSVLIDLWKSEHTLFVFDTNVLLNIYSYADQTQSDFFKILNAIDDKIWIPFHVGLEYQRRRLEVIKSQKETFKNINSYLDKIIKVFKNDFESLALHSRFPSLSKDTDLLKSEIEQSISRYKTIVSELNSNQACVRSHDKIRSKLNDLFHDRVGNAPLDQTWLDNLYNEGNTRYSLKIPPGFCDLKKADNKNTESFTYNGLLYQSKYGDLILWKQLLERSKDPSIKNVIFITDDKKSDWWFSINSNGLKEVGPLAELQAEIYRESEIENFHMYNSSSFLQDGKQNLNINVEDSSIDDINDHNKNNRTVLKNNFSDSLHSHAFMSYDKPDYLKEVEELIKNNLDNSDEYNPFSSVHSNRSLKSLGEIDETVNGAFDYDPLEDNIFINQEDISNKINERKIRMLRMYLNNHKNINFSSLSERNKNDLLYSLKLLLKKHND